MATPPPCQYYWMDKRMQIGASPENLGRTGRSDEARQAKTWLSTLSVSCLYDATTLRCSRHTGLAVVHWAFVLARCQFYFEINESLTRLKTSAMIFKKATAGSPLKLCGGRGTRSTVLFTALTGAAVG